MNDMPVAVVKCIRANALVKFNIMPLLWYNLLEDLLPNITFESSSHVLFSTHYGTYGTALKMMKNQEPSGQD
jgi:hypothetical protein